MTLSREHVVSEPLSEVAFERRSWLTGLAALATLARAPEALAGEARALAPAEAPLAPLRFASAAEERLAVIRVTGSTQDVPSPWWYTGTIYGMRPGEQPRKLVRFEGTEIYRFRQRADGAFEQTARTTSFFQDLQSGEVLERWRNPYTGQTVDVRANLLGGTGSRMIWSDAGLEPQFRRADGQPIASGGPQPLAVTWTAFGRWVWMRHDRVYPPGRAAPSGESSAMLVERRDLENATLSSVPALFSSTYMSPWLSWMGMQGQSGHTLWHADGIKLERIEQLPAPFLERLRRLHPAQLDVRFD